MSQHLAALLSAQGQTLELFPVPTPSLKPYEVLIRTKAIAINPVDWKQRDTGLLIKQFPTVLGWDCAGVVESVGAHVSHLEVGDRVAAFTASNRGVPHGAYQELTVQWADLVVKLPDSLHFDAASTIPCAYMTSAVAIGLNMGLQLPGVSMLSSDVPTNTPIVVLGGSSSVGQLALQLLRNAGYTNVITTASARNHSLVKKLGASTAVDQSAADVVDQIKKAAGGPTQYIYDTVSISETTALASSLVSDDGMIVITTGVQDTVTLPGNAQCIFTESMRCWDMSSTSPDDGKAPSDFAFGKAATVYLAQALAEGSIVPNKVRRVEGGPDFAKALEEGLDLNKKGLSGEKAVVVLS